MTILWTTGVVLSIAISISISISISIAIAISTAIAIAIAIVKVPDKWTKTDFEYGQNGENAIGHAIGLMSFAVAQSFAVHVAIQDEQVQLLPWLPDLYPSLWVYLVIAAMTIGTFVGLLFATTDNPNGEGRKAFFYNAHSRVFVRYSLAWCVVIYAVTTTLAIANGPLGQRGDISVKTSDVQEVPLIEGEDTPEEKVVGKGYVVEFLVTPAEFGGVIPKDVRFSLVAEEGFSDKYQIVWVEGYVGFAANVTRSMNVLPGHMPPYADESFTDGKLLIELNQLHSDSPFLLRVKFAPSGDQAVLPHSLADAKEFFRQSLTLHRPRQN